MEHERHDADGVFRYVRNIVWCVVEYFGMLWSEPVRSALVWSGRLLWCGVMGWGAVGCWAGLSGVVWW